MHSHLKARERLWRGLNLIERNWRRQAPERVRAQIATCERARDQPLGRRRHHNRIRCRPQMRGDIEGLAQGHALGAVADADLINDHWPRMNANAHLEPAGVGVHTSRRGAADLRHDVHGGLHGTARGIVLSGGIAKIDQQAIAERVRDIARVACDDRAAG